MAHELSPEERLLSLIKNKKTEAVRKEQPAAIAPPEEPKPKPDGRQSAGRALKPDVNKKLIYIASGVIAVIAAGIIMLTAFSGKESKEISDLEAMIKSLQEEPKAPVPAEDTSKPGIETQTVAKKPQDMPEPAKDFQDYQKLFQEKTVFTAPAASTQPPKSVGGYAAQGAPLRDMVKDLRLVGVIPGDDPQAIIEDKKSGQTLFLKKGEAIEALEIRDIQTGKVILGSGEETITLSL